MIKVCSKVRVSDPDDEFSGHVGVVLARYESDNNLFLVSLSDLNPPKDLKRYAEHQLKLETNYNNVMIKAGDKPRILELAIDTQTKGQQSQLDARYDLIPPVALKTVAEVLGEGEVKYPTIDGVPNWHYITTKDHLNHALAHVYAYLKGDDTGEDDLSHAATRLLLALEIDRIGVKEK